MPATKQTFLSHLRAELIRLYANPDNPGWAADEKKLDRFMTGVSDTINSPDTVSNIGGPAFVAAWRAIGKRGRPTYKALRALPAS